jgi:hypothetical protein
MNAAVKWGLILGIVVGLLGFVLGGLGLHASPLGGMAFIGLAVLLNVATVVLGLRETRLSATYGRQLLNALIIGVIGAALIFASSWLMTSVVMPDYYAQLRDGYQDFFENSGMPEAQIEQQMKALEEVTPVAGARQGAIGTVITSLVVGAIAGIFLRKK